MSSAFAKLIYTGSKSELITFIERTNDEELSNLVCEKVCNSNGFKILDKVLTSFNDSESEASQVKRRKLVEAVLRTLHENSVTSSHADFVINRIIIDFSKYSKQQLTKLVDFCLARIRENTDEHKSWKEMLPILLEVIEEEKYVSYLGDEISGSQYKSAIVNSICNIQWDLDILSSLAKMFGDISLEKAEHNKVFKALCSKLSEVCLTELPPLVHHLLRLCQYQEDRILLEALQHYFSSQYISAKLIEDSESLEEIGIVSLKEVQETESTVLYHIYHAAQVNHKILNNYISFLKNIHTVPEYIIDPFILGILLLVSEIYEEQVFEIIRLAIVRRLQDDERSRNCMWLRENLPLKWDLLNVFNQVISNSVKDRHLVLKSLIELSFLLMSNEKKLKDERHKLWEIGTSILKRLIKERHDAGLTVLQMLTEKIVANGSHVWQYTECLAYMCRRLSIIVLKNQIWVISLLDQLLHIPADAAIKVLYAILPIIRISASIKDNLMLTLRKALYKKGIVPRKMAVTGLLEMLKASKLTTFSVHPKNHSQMIPNTSNSILTQATLEKNAPRISSSSTLHMQQDVLNILKKCFSYEFEVKLHLYKGLYEAVVNNPCISVDILDMLYTHFNTYYEQDENVLPPINLDKCMDIRGVQVIVTEPIAELLFFMQKIYVLTASNDEVIFDKVSAIFESLCKRMSRIELEHLNLDESTNLIDNPPKSQQTLQALKLFIMIYDSMIAYRLVTWSKNDDNSAQKVYSLFKAKTRFTDYLKQGGKNKKAKKGKGAGNNATNKNMNNTTIKKSARMESLKIPNSLLDMECIVRGLSMLYSDSVPWASEEQTDFLKCHYDFPRYIIQGLIHYLQNLKSLNYYSLQREKNLNIKLYCDTGELLYKRILPRLEDMTQEDPLVALLAIEAFKELCNLMCTHFFSEMHKFLIIEYDVNSDITLGEKIFKVVSVLRSHLKILIREEDNDDANLKKIPLVLIETIRILTYKIDFAESKMEKVEVTIDNKYEILKENRFEQAYNVLNVHLKEKLGNVSWILSRIQAEHTIYSTSGPGRDTLLEKLKTKERNLCRQLAHIIQMHHTLANTSVEPGHSTDSMYKNLHLLYTKLSTLTKYFNSTSTNQHPSFQAVKFVQVVQLAGKPLKSAFYNFVTHTDESQNKHISRARTDTNAQRNKILKETKIIPRVVYAIEIFCKEILLLSKKTGIPLEDYVKHSVTRDFRINNSELAETLEKMNVSMLITQDIGANDNESTESTIHTRSDSDEEEMPPPSKRPRCTPN
ncbi:Fanconi anemia group I protein homolog isoform X2 [Prorops nasuta]|uniref:Fanconi anemia group I protein homolog isoform X2 n=1 Tax=Prorops nasuta TaxID=863751 RepID=UPI0034CED315